MYRIINGISRSIALGLEHVDACFTRLSGNAFATEKSWGRFHVQPTCHYVQVMC